MEERAKCKRTRFGFFPVFAVFRSLWMWPLLIFLLLPSSLYGQGSFRGFSISPWKIPWKLLRFQKHSATEHKPTLMWSLLPMVVYKMPFFQSVLERKGTRGRGNRMKMTEEKYSQWISFFIYESLLLKIYNFINIFPFASCTLFSYINFFCSHFLFSSSFFLQASSSSSRLCCCCQSHSFLIFRWIIHDAHFF